MQIFWKNMEKALTIYASRWTIWKKESIILKEKGFRYIEGRRKKKDFAYIDADKVGGMKVEMVDYDMMAFYERLLREQTED